MPSDSVEYRLLKEFLLGKLVDLNEIRDVKLEGLAKELRNDAKLKEKALELQAKEIERRLISLNNENERILVAANKSVSRDTFEAFEREYREYKLTTEKTVSEKSNTLEKLVNATAKSLKDDFDQYKSTTAQATELARGLKLGSSKVMTLVISIVAFLWAVSAVIGGVFGIYSFFKPKPSDPEVLRLMKQQTELIANAFPSPSPSPTPAKE